MGFNATLVILNDRLSEIESDPEFGKKVADAIRSFSRSRPDRMPYITGQTQVVEVAHADALQVVAVGGNTGRVIGYGHYTDSDDSLIRWLERSRRDKAREAKKASPLTGPLIAQQITPMRLQTKRRPPHHQETESEALD